MNCVDRQLPCKTNLGVWKSKRPGLPIRRWIIEPPSRTVNRGWQNREGTSATSPRLSSPGGCSSVEILHTRGDTIGFGRLSFLSAINDAAGRVQWHLSRSLR